jgi:hypothetical protein
LADQPRDVPAQRVARLDAAVRVPKKPHVRHTEHGGRTVPADAFRLTIEFADGRSVTNLDPAPSDPEVPAFEQPMLSSGPGTGLVGSGSSPDRWGWDMDYRVRPLPPPRPLAFVCVWPERGIPPSWVEVDGAAVLRAADTAVRLCSDDPYCSAD